jgi:predicted amidohydrolase
VSSTNGGASTNGTSTRMKVAAIQMHSALGDLDANGDRIEQLTRQAASAGASLIVTPECALSGYASDDLLTIWQAPSRMATTRQRGLDVLDIAIAEQDEHIARFRDLCSSLGIRLLLSFIEHDHDRFFNSSILIDGDGQTQLHYRKINPWPFCESRWATRGGLGVPTAESELGKVGVGICYDVQFTPPRLAEQGVDWMLFPTAWVDLEPPESFFDDELPALARSLNMGIICANRCVRRQQWWHGSGWSCVIDRAGKVLARARDPFADEVVIAEIEVGTTAPSPSARGLE